MEETLTVLSFGLIDSLERTLVTENANGFETTRARIL